MADWNALLGGDETPPWQMPVNTLMGQVGPPPVSPVPHTTGPYAAPVSEFTTPEDLRRQRISAALGWDVGHPWLEFARRILFDVPLGLRVAPSRVPVPAPLRARGRSGTFVDPPSPEAGRWQPRSFSDDYPSAEGRFDPTSGRLTVDIDGRPIHDDAVVVGRQMVGGGDVAFPSAQELAALGESRLGLRYQRIPAAAFDEGTLAEIAIRPRRTGSPNRPWPPHISQWPADLRAWIGIADDVGPEAAAARVTAHETGHAFDHLAVSPRTGQQVFLSPYNLPQQPRGNMLRELQRVYSDLNGGDVAAAGAAGDVRLVARSQLRFPSDFGYSARETPAELWAEAIRAYLTDPSYLKAVAPEVAATIRASVNRSPRLAPYIHLNSLLAPIGVGAAAAPSLMGEPNDLMP